MIYLDHNAATPILPEVPEAMMPYLTSEWGKPSSTCKFGSRLKGVIETARAQAAGDVDHAHALSGAGVIHGEVPLRDLPSQRRENHLPSLMCRRPPSRSRPSLTGSPD